MKRNISLRIAASAILALLPLSFAFSQAASLVSANEDGASAASSSVVANTPRPAVSPQPLTERWLDVNTLSYSARFRKSSSTAGRSLYDFGQERYIADGRFKFDSQGRYAVAFHASSGRYFNWAYADVLGGDYREAIIASRPYNSPAFSAAVGKAFALDPNAATFKKGYPTRGGYFYLRQLYASATPIDQVTLEFGSLPVDHGTNSEITSFDDDGYIAGERIRVHDPKHLYFDRVGATWAFIGDSLTPNFFARANDLTQSNYAQYLVEKKFSKHLTASTDFTEIRGSHTWREAASIRLPHTKVVDSILAEFYQRTNSTLVSGISYAGANGFAVSATRNFFKRVDFTGGYDSIDRYYGVYSGSIYLTVVGNGWNGDAYSVGRRAFTKVNVKLGRGVTAFAFYGHLIPNADPNTVAGTYTQLQGYNAGMNFNLKDLINAKRQVF